MTSETGQTDTKVKELSHHLRTLAREKGPGAQLPPVRVLCERLATTRVTLREALAVLEAEKIIYTRSRKGIFVSPNIYHKSLHVLFSSQYFTASPASPFWNMLWMHMERETQSRAAFKDEVCTFHLIRPTDDPYYSLPEKIETTLRAERVDGVLSIGFHSLAKGVLSTGKIPCVTFAGEGLCTIYLDAFAFIQLAIEALTRQNCQRIGLWVFNVPSSPPEKMENIQAFRRLLQEYHKPLYPELIRTPHLLPSPTSLSLQEQGYLLVKEIFGGPVSARPDGLIIGDDMITDGALVAFDELGIRIGHDLQVITHANVGSPILFGRTRHMTVIEYDPAHVAQAMFSALDMLMAGQKPEELKIQIPPRLRP